MFRDGVTTVDFAIEWREIIEVRDTYGASADKDRYGTSGDEDRRRYDRLGIQPTYMRYYATGELTVTGSEGTVTETGDMIYEFNYPGRPDPRAHI